MLTVWVCPTAKTGLLVLKVTMPLDAPVVLGRIVPQADVLLLWHTVMLELPALKLVMLNNEPLIYALIMEGLLLLETK